MVKVITYNLNGVRSAVSKGLAEWMASVDADVLCFQETKAHEADIPSSLFEQMGYVAHWFSAEKKGYSGVGILSKERPLFVEKGNAYPQSNAEGRVLFAEFQHYALVSAYFPSGSSGEDRQTYKYQWLEEFDSYVSDLRRRINKPLIICGDYNICHHPIDIHDPIRNVGSSGFLPEERAWMSQFLEKQQLQDSFRYIHPYQRDAYTWWSFRANARANNKGWRIDYICVSADHKTAIQDAGIAPNARHSDHCPAWATFQW